MFLLILFFLCLSAGLYLILCSAARLPTIGTTMAAMKAVHPKEQKSSLLHAVVSRLSAALARRIKLSESRKDDLQIKLKMAGSSVTPEYHAAKTAVNLFLWLALAALLAVISPFLGVIAAGYGIYMMTRDISSLDRAGKARRDRIDAELPRLAATLAQELQSSRDVIGILASFLPSTTPEFRDELQITLADMRSGSPEKALWRMNRRVGSIMLSEIVRGLQMVLQGDDAVSYFQTLQNDFKQAEIQGLSLEAKKRPDKVRVYSFAMLICFMGTVMAVMLLYAYAKLRGMM